MLLIGYFEGIDSERGICWRCADSLSLREFLGLGPTESVPDHSSLCRNRGRLPLEVHDEVFVFVLGLLEKASLLKGKYLGIDASGMEANAAMKSIVRRDTGETYQEMLERLAEESGIKTPSRADLIAFNHKRQDLTEEQLKQVVTGRIGDFLQHLNSLEFIAYELIEAVMDGYKLADILTCLQEIKLSDLQDFGYQVLSGASEAVEVLVNPISE